MSTQRERRIRLLAAAMVVVVFVLLWYRQHQASAATRELLAQVESSVRRTDRLTATVGGPARVPPTASASTGHV